jgi:hydrogenase expression/formation protein HypE
MFFPGGDLGKLAVCGTVNDLSVAGANPGALSASFIIEEGFEISQLESVVRSMANEAEAAGVKIVCGDTKVVGKGQADGLYINTSGLGFVKKEHEHIAGGQRVCPGDVVLISGCPGDHEAAVINARESFFEESRLVSDCASLNPLIENLMDCCGQIRFMRDITRGGLSGILSELTEKTQTGIDIHEESVPLNASVEAFCEILGYEFLHFASEGKFILVISAEEADQALKIMHAHQLGSRAACIGNVVASHPGQVVMQTRAGGRRILEPLQSTKVPRIC